MVSGQRPRAPPGAAEKAEKDPKKPKLAPSESKGIASSLGSGVGVTPATGAATGSASGEVQKSAAALAPAQAPCGPQRNAVPRETGISPKCGKTLCLDDGCLGPEIADKMCPRAEYRPNPASGDPIGGERAFWKFGEIHVFATIL